MTVVFISRGAAIDTGGGGVGEEGCVETRTKSGHIAAHQGTPGSHQRLEETRGINHPLEPSEQVWPWPPEQGEKSFSYFKILVICYSSPQQLIQRGSNTEKCIRCCI